MSLGLHSRVTPICLPSNTIMDQYNWHYHITTSLTSLLPMCVIKLWYNVAATTIASSGVWQTNPWHSSCLGTELDRITIAKSGEWRLDDSLLLSAALNGRKRLRLSIFSGSVINGRKAAPPSDDDTTNLTADQTAIFWNGVIWVSFPFACRTLRPMALMSNVPALWFWEK